MKETTFNPYGFIGDNIGPGLDAIIAGLPPSGATVSQLVDEVYTYVSALYYASPSRQTQEQMKAVIYNAINSVQNNLVLGGSACYIGAQRPFLEMLIGDSINILPSQGFLNRITDIEDNVGISGLSVGEQIPLFLATTVGTAAYNYWSLNVVDPAAPVVPPNPWNGYMVLSGQWAQNLANIPFWSAGAMNGALSGYGATPQGQGLIDPSTNAVSADMISALSGALAATAGMVIFRWIPRIVKPMTLNTQRIISMQGNTTQGGGEPARRFGSIGHNCSEVNQCHRQSYKPNGECCEEDKLGCILSMPTRWF